MPFWSKIFLLVSQRIKGTLVCCRCDCKWGHVPVVSATWRKPIADHGTNLVADRLQTIKIIWKPGLTMYTIATQITHLASSVHWTAWTQTFIYNPCITYTYIKVWRYYTQYNAGGQVKYLFADSTVSCTWIFSAVCYNLSTQPLHCTIM